MSKFICELCNKEYCHKQSLYNHKKRIHKNEKIDNVSENKKKNNKKSYNVSKVYPKCIQNSNKFVSKNGYILDTNNKNNLELENNNSISKYKCDYCDRTYKYSSGKYKHQKKCKLNNNISIEEMDNKIDLLKEEFMKILTANFKMHPKKFEKLRREMKTINNIHNTTNNNTLNNNTLNNNGMININNTIIALGKEDFRHVLSKQQQIDIVNKGTDCIKYFLNITHFNPNTPQYLSFIITNSQNKIAYIYDEDTNQYVATTKDELIFNIFDERCDDIREFIEFHEDEIKAGIVKRVHQFINRIESDHKFNKKQVGELRVFIYDKTKHLNVNKFKMIKS